MENTNIWNVYQCTPQPGKLDFNIKKKRATKKFNYGCQAQTKLQLSWTGLLYPQLIHHKLLKMI